MADKSVLKTALGGGGWRAISLFDRHYQEYGGSDGLLLLMAVIFVSILCVISNKLEKMYSRCLTSNFQSH